MNNSPVREIKGKVDLYNGSTLLNTFTYRDKLTSISVERTGDSSKFFGFGVCQKLEIELVDDKRELEITTSHSFKAYLTSGDDYADLYPTFYVSEVNRDENTNALSIVAYDKLYGIKRILYNGRNDFDVGKPIYYVRGCSSDIGLPTEKQPIMMPNGEIAGYVDAVVIETPNIPNTDPFYTLEFEGGINVNGSESVKDILDGAADMAQAIYYLDAKDHLVFKRLDVSGEPVLTITKSDYFTLKAKTPRTLKHIVSTNDLGDKEPPYIEDNGLVQYVRNNPFWDLRDDRAELVANATAAITGLTIYPIECEWRGNYLLELGDKVNFITKDNETIVSYILNDKIEYTGGLKQTTEWRYEDETETETEKAPSSLGEALKQTFAKVDKVNGEITLLSSRVDDTETNMSNLKVETDAITASVSKIETDMSDSLEQLDGEIDTLTKTVETKMTSEEVSIVVKSELANGVDKVETAEKGFTFNDEGLTVSNPQSNMKTTITEDGMTVYRNDEAVLVADNEGVKAEDLHATSYLIIGTNSRFEDYLNKTRTGCFWIGGNS